MASLRFLAVRVGDLVVDTNRRQVTRDGERIGLTYVDKATGERKPLTSDNPYFMSEEFMQERWLLGTPAEIAAKLVKWQPRLKMDHLIFTPRPPGMSLRQAVDEVAAIAKDVLPVLRAI